jgi:hypothetical protein
MNTQIKSAFLKPMISIAYWLQLPMDVRVEMRKVFNIKRSSGSQVINQLYDGKKVSTVVSDGTTPQDLAVLTVEKLQNFTGVDSTDIIALFEQTAQIINAGLHPVKEEVVEVPKKFETFVETPEPKKVRKPLKTNKI